MNTPNLKCCPGVEGTPLTYIEDNGLFWNTYTNQYELLIYYWSDAGEVDPSAAFGKCVKTQPSPRAYGELFDPVACPCCPDNYTYSQQYLTCAGDKASDGFRDPIPCIPCVCEEPPIPEECVDCENPAISISFNINTRIKRCVDCDNTYTQKGYKSVAKYAADDLIDPIIFFKLK